MPRPWLLRPPRWLQSAVVAAAPIACGGQMTSSDSATAFDAAPVEARAPAVDATPPGTIPPPATNPDAAARPDRAADQPAAADLSSADAPVSADAPAGRQRLIEEVVASIQEDEVRALLQKMEEMSRPSRATRTDNYLEVTEWVRELMAAEAPRITVRFDQHGDFRNVEMTLPGSDPGAALYILGGHLDSVPRSPGIDDNGTGALGTAVVARALGRHRFKANLRFVLFDAEEIGLVGSSLYAKALRAGGCAPASCLRFFLNMDMIGHDPDNLRRIQVFTARQSIFDLLVQAETAQRIGLSVVRGGTEECNQSDDCSFSRAGYDTGYVFESKYYPRRHTPADTVMAVNFDTFTRTLKLVAAALATAAEIEAAHRGDDRSPPD